MTIKLYDHQRRGVETLTVRPRFALSWGCGCGKTIAILAAIDAIGGKTIVLAPKSVLSAAWLADARHFPKLCVKVMSGDDAKSDRAKIIHSPWDVLVASYDSFRIHFKDFPLSVRRLVVDESSKIRNPSAKITKCCTEFGDRCESIWLMSGTPAPNGPHEYVPQLRAMGKEVVGPSYYGAMNRFFYPVKRKLRTGATFVETWKQSLSQETAFNELLKKWTWSLKLEDCLDLPEFTDVVREVTLSAAERDAYERAKENLILLSAEGEPSKIKREAALIKLRQIVGGSCRVAGEDTQIGSSKLDALADVLDEIGKEPVVIFAEFRKEIERIVGLCKDRGETVETIYGETSWNSKAAVELFQSGGVDRIVCHPQSAAHGITLHRAAYMVHYSNSFSLENYEQSRARIRRSGQVRPQLYIELVAKDTVDENIRKVLGRKQTASDAMKELLGQD